MKSRSAEAQKDAANLLPPRKSLAEPPAATNDGALNQDFLAWNRVDRAILSMGDSEDEQLHKLQHPKLLASDFSRQLVLYSGIGAVGASPP